MQTTTCVVLYNKIFDLKNDLAEDKKFTLFRMKHTIYDKGVLAMISTQQEYPRRPTSAPEAITRMARKHHLGRRHTIYYKQFEMSSFFIVELSLFFSSGMLLFASIFMLRQWYQGIETYSSVVVIGYFLLFLGILLLYIVGRGIYRLYENRMYGWFVYIYDKGCIIQKRRGVAQPFTWNEIAIIWLKCNARRKKGSLVNEDCIIESKDGYTMILSQRGGNVNTVTEVITRQLCKHLLPHALAEYEKGRQVQFGPCGVNQECFTTGEKDDYKWLPWSRFDRLEIKASFLLIYEQGEKVPWARLFTPTIPNLPILLKLVELVRDKAAQQVHDPGQE